MFFNESNLAFALEHAISRKELSLLYQPQLSQDNKQYLEVLLRWQHPFFGLISPDIFIGIAQENNLLSGITTWVVDSVMQKIEQVDTDVVFAINVCPSLLTDEFTNLLINQVKEKNVHPKRIEIELTEGVKADLKPLQKIIQQLRREGFSVSLDDFGSGYSSMNYLASLEVDVVKIDKSLVHGALDSRSSYVILSTLISLCHTLDCKVVCEGVENDEMLSMVKTLGADRIQGFFISKPVTLDQALQTFKKPLLSKRGFIKTA